jgi:hypothetical protein
MRTLLAILGVLTTIGFINMMGKFIVNLERNRTDEYPSDIVALVLGGVLTFVFFYYASRPKKTLEEKKTKQPKSSNRKINLIREVYTNVIKTKDKLSDVSSISNVSWILENQADKQIWIFRKGNSLLVSKKGIVETGKWEYFIESKSILIDINSEERLYNIKYVSDNKLSIELDSNDIRLDFIRKNNQTDNQITTSSVYVLKHIKGSPENKKEERIVNINLGNRGYTLKMGKYQQYLALHSNGKVYKFYKKLSTGSYYVYSKNDIVMFNNEKECLRYLSN